MKDGYVLLCPNAHRDHGLASTLAIAEALRKHGHEVRISPFLSDGLENTWPRDIPTAALPMALPGARLVVSLGGDGTILQLSRYLAGSGVPMHNSMNHTNLWKLDPMIHNLYRSFLIICRIRSSASFL